MDCIAEFLFFFWYLEVECKAIHVKAWTGPEDSRELRLQDYMAIGTWRWQCCQPYTPAAFAPQKIFLVLIFVRG